MIRLAKLVGYHDIEDYMHGGFVGVYLKTTGSRRIPAWLDDPWESAKLQAQHEVSLEFDHLGSVVPEYYGKPVLYEEHDDPEAAIRFAIALGVIKKLEQEKENAGAA